ncbi:MAG: hypothetical protein ABFE01_08150 [Phycisphaerales bacterium]
MRIDRIFRTLLLVIGSSVAASAGQVAAWDFSQGAQGWQGNSYVKDFAASSESLAFTSTGIDPWIEGPAIDLPGSGMTRVHIRMKSNADSGGELFYGRGFEAGRSVRFSIQNDNRWHEYALVITEPLGPQTRFPLDPATTEGRIVVASIRVETLASFEPPQFKKPQRALKGTSEFAPVSSGELRLDYSKGGSGSFAVEVGGEEMACGYQADQIGLMIDDRVAWLELEKATVSCSAEPDGGFVITAVLKDDRAGQWKVTRRFTAGPYPGSLVTETTFVVDRDCEVLYLPWLTLFPGLGTFGEHKTQGLFAGLEYLDDEPSSSEADITTREHVRRVPDPIKITFPLMAVVHGGRYLGLIWEPSELVAPTFDSPDRIYNSGAHVMALTAPAVGDKRFENAALAHTPFTTTANQPMTMRAMIIGGRGDSVVPAVQKYVEVKGLPTLPQSSGGFDAAVTLLSHGWIDSAINERGLFRHAVWGESFKAGPAGDAIMYMDWLANHTTDSELAERLIEARDLAVTKMPQGQPYMSTVSHTGTPTAPFVFGGVYPYVERRRADAESLLANFDEQGIKLYRPRDVDYGKTHFAQHANGHAAPDLANILEAATLSGDQNLIRQGLALLDKQTALYANSVPRGAQVWEVPLHTPDILAAAHLVKAYTLGYMISRKPAYLEQARYWAWTGVPFVYLANPTEGQVGPYATIAVLGATNWKAPVWFGQPVQWCGLVYGSALHLLSQYDTEGPWATIAKGITAAGLQMTWPTSDAKRQGLLPDYYLLRPQVSEGPAINPGTIQAHLPELFDNGSLYEVRRLEKTGWFVHAPCAIRNLKETDDSVTFAVDGWDSKTCYILLAGVQKAPTVTISPQGTNAADFNAGQKLAVITITGPAQIEVRP